MQATKGPPQTSRAPEKKTAKVNTSIGKGSMLGTLGKNFKSIAAKTKRDAAPMAEKENRP